MNIRHTTIAKLQQLSERLLQEVSDFIDFVIHKHRAEIANSQPDEVLIKTWSRWFESVDHLDVTPLDVTPPEPASTYQRLLINKYQQQGLEL
ncbi:hypothetical protein [Phormidium sp. FACHB-1136]|uniref:hypothetical protein n=1 Tax=Phormidium sp. FACHB-1136 TaxID=2692848 RepID=UPI001689630E|nr:hypothetical protein [Phormidium sp. FACHB-1136]MBD2429450.1 hypothetical protein [Phormidium sp. FACHB-1136]